MSVDNNSIFLLWNLIDTEYRISCKQLHFRKFLFNPPHNVHVFDILIIPKHIWMYALYCPRESHLYTSANASIFPPGLSTPRSASTSVYNPYWNTGSAFSETFYHIPTLCVSPFIPSIQTIYICCQFHLIFFTKPHFCVHSLCSLLSTAQAPIIFTTAIT